MTACAELIALIREYTWTRHQKVLLCAQDVADDLLSGSSPARAQLPWEGNLAWLMGIDVTVTPDSPPGSWRMVRHDHCSVIDVTDADGRTDLAKSYVSHEGCTILAESQP